METQEAENTVRLLCAQVSALQGRKLKRVRIELKDFLREHTEVLRSMSDETFEALRKVWRL
jgi:hypothetical protein